ncbi:MAG: hypothetical protein PHE24_03765 [Patescibacteria group bacterium]|nr:hypothetical protein [Patescibacteria group bacterium]
MLRKILIGSVMFMTVLSMSVVVAPQGASAAASAGDLIKINGLSSVYYLGANGKRYVFPNQSTYFSWYKDFSGVITIPASEMEGYPLAANVVVRPGTKLIKSPSINTVYAVEPNGVLRSIVSEANAISLWGANWAKMVIDVPDSFFVNYTVGTPLAVGAYPIGQLIKTAGSPDVMLLAADGTARKFASQAAFDANSYNFDYVATVPTAYVMPSTGAVVNGIESGLNTVSQSGVVPGPVAGGSAVSVALASDSPAAASVAKNSSVPMLKFNLTASNDGAALINGITLTADGLGAVSAITNVVLFANGTRIGNVKNTVDSNREAIFNLATPLSIPAGQTVAITVKAKITDTNQHNLSVLQAADISASGATVSGSFPIAGNTMSGVDVTVGALTLSQDGNPSDVNLGDVNAVIGKFKFANDNVEEITLNSITVQRSDGTSVNSDFANLALYLNGVKIASSAGFSGKSNGYATFVLTSPLVIKKNQTVKFEVHADIVDGRAADTTVISVDSTSDIDAVGSVYGQSATITASVNSFYQSTYAAGTRGFVINAGTIALGVAQAPSDKVKSNSTGVVFGVLKITSNSSANATFDTLKVTITGTNDGNIGSVAFRSIENVKLVEESTGQGFDLEYASGAAYAKVYGAINNIGKTLTTGQTYTFDLVADVKASSTNQSYVFAIANATTDLIVHDQNNTAITDITPNSVTYNSVTVQAPAVTFSINPLSTPFSKVVGTTNVLAVYFNMKANQTSDLKVTDLQFTGSTTLFTTTLAASHAISQFRLYQCPGGVPGTTPIKSVSTVATNVIDFNNLSLSIPANQTVQYCVTEDINSDNTLSGKGVYLGVSAYSIGDVDNNSVYDATNDSNLDGTMDSVMNSARKVAFLSSGSLFVAIDNTDTNTSRDTIQVDGAASTGYLAAIKLRATNEAVKIQDLTVGVLDPTTTIGNTNANKMFASLSITDSSGLVLASVNDVLASTTFTGFNHVVPVGTETLYLKGVLNPIGQDQINVSHASSSFVISDLTNSKGVSSNVTLTEATTTTSGTCASSKVCYAVSTAAQKNMRTDQSKVIDSVASRISSVDLVASAPGCALATSLSGGPNTLAILKVTTDANSNTLSTGDPVKTILSSIRVNVLKNATTTFDFWTIEKCSGTTGSTTYATTLVTTANGPVVFPLMSHLGVDAQIVKQDTSYYAIKGDVSAMESGTGNDWVEVDLDTLDGAATTGNIGWQDSSEASPLYKLLLSITKVTGVKILEP